MLESRVSQLIFAILLVAFCIGGYIIFKERDTLFGSNVVKEDIANKRYDIILQADNQRYPIPALYRLQEGSLIVQEGNITLDKYEVFSQARKDTKYTLTTYSPDYYLNTTECSWNISLCSVQMDKVANPFINFAQTAPNEATLFISIEQGTVIQEPLFCFSYGYTITHLKMGLEKVTVPSHLKKTQDICFLSRSNIQEPQTQWKIQFEKVAQNGVLEVTLLDKGYNKDLQLQYEEGNLPDINVATFIK